MILQLSHRDMAGGMPVNNRGLFSMAFLKVRSSGAFLMLEICRGGPVSSKDHIPTLRQAGSRMPVNNLGLVQHGLLDGQMIWRILDA